MKIFGIIVQTTLVLYGYFQTEKYFKHIEKQIREAFTFVDDIREPTEEAFKSNFGDTEVIAIHLRRGDYLKYPNHPVQSLNIMLKDWNICQKIFL
jgi:hypothetical protein